MATIINGVGRVGIRQYVSPIPVYPTSLKLFIDAGNPLSYPGTGTTVTDLIGTQNGTLLNGTSYSSADGGSFVFDGINDSITFGTNMAIKPTTSGTISIMAKYTTKPGGGYTGALFANEPDSDRKGVYIFQDNSPIKSNLCSNTTFTQIGFSDTSLRDTWNLLTLTWDGVNIKTYNNGVLYFTKPQTLQVTSDNTYNTVLGSFTTSGANPLKGNISYLKIYDNAINQAQVTEDFNEIKGRYGY